MALNVKPATPISCFDPLPALFSQVTPELLFSNLPSILSAHQMFWQEVIYPMLQEARRTGKPFDPMRLEAGCLQVCVHCKKPRRNVCRCVSGC